MSVRLIDDPGYLLTYVELADRKSTLPDVSPVYLWLMTLMRGAGLSVESIRAIHLVALVAAAVFCALAAKRLGGWIAAIATAVLILGNRAAIVVAAELDPKALVFLLTSVALFGVVTHRPVLAGLSLGLSAATHPYGYLMLLVALMAKQRIRIAIAAILPIALVLVLAPVAQHAGSQLYEGNNPLATGCGGVAPRVVSELQAKHRHLTPDPVYRAIAGGRKNYWRDKALAFMTTHPSAALRLLAHKALLTIHHYDVHDLLTARRRAHALARVPMIPFGVAFVLAAAALVLRRGKRELIPIALFALVLIGALTLFVVSARQRNVLLAPLAILGGVGVAEIVALARARSERALLAFGAVLIASALLGIESAPIREYEHMWRTSLGLAVDPESPAHVFDAAIAHSRRGRWREADSLLASLGDYQPLRQSAAVASVAYYRARAALAMQLPPSIIAGFVARASEEAPGDPHVLALRAAMGDADAAARLDALHDPLTRDAALAIARHANSTTTPRSGSSGAGR